MGEIDHEIASEIARLQADVTSALEKLEGLPEDHPRYELLFDQMVKASSALMEYEASVPAKREEPHRKVSKTALTWSTRVHGLGAVLLGVAPLTGLISWWWTVLAVFQLVVAVLAGSTQAPVEGHRQMRFAAGVLGAVTVLVPLLVFDVLSGWFWIAAALGWLLAFVLATDADSTHSREGRAAA